MVDSSNETDAPTGSSPWTAAEVEGLADQLEQNLPDFLNEQYGGHGDTISFRRVGVVLDSDADHRESGAQDYLSSIQITHVKNVEVHNLRVGAEDDKQAGLAELRLFGDILGKVDRHRDGAPDDVAVTIDFSSDYVDVPASIRWDHDGQIEDVTATDTAVLVATETEVLYAGDDDDLYPYK
ncbi:hypothetical protein ACTU6U_14820 [Microbacterium sp. A196]|uniref:hypothetical protein n=1 Tax=Microbacterium sp. A196 TaxID=3457320 RepID=UPI003FD4F020